MNNPRRDKGIPRLTERDRYVLSWICEQYAVRFDTLQKLLSRMSSADLIHTRNVYRIIKRWETAGMAEYQTFWHDSPGWVWLTGVGLKAQAVSYAPWSPRQGTDFEHLHAINEVRYRLEERYSFIVPWQSERYLLSRK